MGSYIWFLWGTSPSCFRVWHFVYRCGLTGYAQVISTYIWSDEARKEMGSHFKLRKVETMRTPRVDHVMRSLSHSSTQNSCPEIAGHGIIYYCIFRILNRYLNYGVQREFQTNGE